VTWAAVSKCSGGCKIPLRRAVVLCGVAMADLLGVFDECIEKLIAEIKEIEEGEHDHQLDLILSYPILPEYLSKLGPYCQFPVPPRLTTNLKGSIKDEEEEVASLSSVLASERRTSRVIKKRKLDGDENEVCGLGHL
jgi:hypothetical protein